MAKKFLKLVESTIQRYTNGGFLVGDRVTLVADYKSKESWKSLNDNTKSYVEDMFNNNDLNKKIINVRTKDPATVPAGIEQRGAADLCDVAVELANGLYDNQNAVTLPCDLLDVQTDYINRSPVPDSQRYDNKVQIEPKEVDEDEENEHQTMTQQGDSLKKSNRSLPKKNTTIPSKPATPSPAVSKYTAEYMPKETD